MKYYVTAVINVSYYFYSTDVCFVMEMCIFCGPQADVLNLILYLTRLVKMMGIQCC